MFESLQPAGSGAWDAALLAPVAELNEQMLAYLRRLALARESTSAVPLRLVDALRRQWRALDEAALRRLSACPFLLLDAGFSQQARWDQLSPGGVGDSARVSYFRDGEGVALLRRTLVLAWHAARSNRLMAGVALGMSAASAERIAHRRLQELEALAERAPAWMAPRWERQPIVWQQMIAAACSERTLTLRQVHRRGLQLLARECLRA